MQSPFADVLEELRRGSRARRFGVGAGHKLSAVIVRAAGEDLFPRLGVGGLEVVAVRQLLDFLRGQSGEKVPGQHAQERVAQTVDAFEMLEEEDQPFEMGGFELAVDAVKRVRDRMGDRLLSGDSFADRKCSRAAPRSRHAALRKFPRPADEFYTDREENKS